MLNGEHGHGESSRGTMGTWDYSLPRYPHGTSVREYFISKSAGFTPHMDPLARGPAQDVSMQPQPCEMPLWPSMLKSQSDATPQAMILIPTQLGQQVSSGLIQAPVTAVAVPSAPTLKAVLTDSDRKKMCQFKEENPKFTHVAIGKWFGVERSTVSKILQKKDKYLQPSDGSSRTTQHGKKRQPPCTGRNRRRKPTPHIKTSAHTSIPNIASPTTLAPKDRDTCDDKNDGCTGNYTFVNAQSRKASFTFDTVTRMSGPALQSRQASGAFPEGLHRTNMEEDLRVESPHDHLESAGPQEPLHEERRTSPSTVSSIDANSTFPCFTSLEHGIGCSLLSLHPEWTPPSGNDRSLLASPQPMPEVFRGLSGLTSSFEGAWGSVMSENQDAPAFTASSSQRTQPLLSSPAATVVEKRGTVSSSAGSAAQTPTGVKAVLRALDVVSEFLVNRPSGLLNHKECVIFGRVMGKLQLQSQEFKAPEEAPVFQVNSIAM